MLLLNFTWNFWLHVRDFRLSNRLGKVKVSGEISCAKPSKGPSHNPASMACSFVWKCSTASWHDWRVWGFWGRIKSMTNGHDIEWKIWKIGKTARQCFLLRLFSQKSESLRFLKHIYGSVRCCHIESWFILIYCILLTYFPMSFPTSHHPTGTFLPGWNRLCWPSIHHGAPNCQQDEVIKELQGVVTRLMNHCYHLNIRRKKQTKHTQHIKQLQLLSFHMFRS